MKSGILLDSYRLPLIRGLEAAAVAGVDGVQFYAKGGQEELTLRTAEELRAFRREAETLHLELAALCMELGGHGFRNSAENPAKLAAAEAVLHIAGQLEIPVVTTHIGVIPALPDSPIYVEMLRSMRLLGGAAARRGITIGIETGPEPPEILRGFIDRCGEGVGVNLDPANLVMVLGSDPVHAVDVLGDYVVHTHFKDGVHYRNCEPERVYDAFAAGGFEALQKETGELFAETAPGTGSVDFPAYLAALRRIGYDGYLTVEREAGKDSVADVNSAAAFLKQLLKEGERR